MIHQLGTHRVRGGSLGVALAGALGFALCCGAGHATPAITMQVYAHWLPNSTAGIRLALRYPVRYLVKRLRTRSLQDQIGEFLRDLW
jgi:hypothetical protein